MPSAEATADPGWNGQALLRAAGAVWGLALILRLVYLLQIQHMGFFTQPASDAAIYVSRARAIAAGDWLGGPDFVHAPLYAYVLGIVHLLGGGFWAIRLVQSLFGATACALLVVIGSRLFGRLTGLLAGLLLAIYPPALFFDGLIQKTSMTLLLCTVMLWLLLVRVDQARWWRWGLVGILQGLLALTRQNTLALVPLLVAWILLGVRGVQWRRRMAHAAAFGIGLVAALLPWAVRNRVVIGDFVLTTPNFGQNFAMGNCAAATGTYTEFKIGSGRAEDEQLYWVKEVERAIGRTPTAQEVSDYYLRQALAWISGNPGQWLRLQAKKWGMVWNAYEAFDTEDYYLYREHASLLRLDHVWHFGMLAPLACAGLVLTARQWQRLWLLYGWLLLSALAVAVFVVFARYRFPLVPVLCLLAAAGVAAAITSLRQKKFVGPAAAGVVLVLVGYAVNRTIDSPRRPQPTSYANHAIALRDSHRYEEAVAELRKGLALNPSDVAANLVMATTLAEMGNFVEALSYGQRARDAAPSYAAPYAAIGDALQGLGRIGEAIVMYRRALELDPEDYRAMNVLAVALAQLGQTQEALELLAKVLSLAPDFAEGYGNRGTVYFKSGRLDEAARDFERALALRPDLLTALNNLGQVELQRGRSDRAAALFERALQIDPSYEPARRGAEQARAARRPE